jgi:hypothetical protein
VAVLYAYIPLDWGLQALPLMLPLSPHRRHAATNVTLTHVDCYNSVQYLRKKE